MSNIADELQRAALEDEVTPVFVGIAAVVAQNAVHTVPALDETVLERALHQPEPVAVDIDLVERIDCRDGILAVLDGGDGAFDQDVGEPGRMRLADRMNGVDAQIDMQAIVPQKDMRLVALAVMGDELGRNP